MATLLDEKQAAEYLKMSVGTLQKWRHLHRGPAYIKYGRCVRYNSEDLNAFLESRRVSPATKTV